MLSKFCDELLSIDNGKYAKIADKRLTNVTDACRKITDSLDCLNLKKNNIAYFSKITDIDVSASR